MPVAQCGKGRPYLMVKQNDVNSICEVDQLSPSRFYRSSVVSFHAVNHSTRGWTPSNMVLLSQVSKFEVATGPQRLATPAHTSGPQFESVS